jgi:hypothetical protein
MDIAPIILYCGLCYQVTVSTYSPRFLLMLETLWRGKQAPIIAYVSLRFNCDIWFKERRKMMSLTPSWEVDVSSAIQEIPCPLWNQTFHYRFHKNPPHFTILSQMIPVYTSHHISLRSILISSSHLRLGLPIFSSLQAFQNNQKSFPLGFQWHFFTSNLWKYERGGSWPQLFAPSRKSCR